MDKVRLRLHLFNLMLEHFALDDFLRQLFLFELEFYLTDSELRFEVIDCKRCIFDETKLAVFAQLRNQAIIQA